MIRQKQTVGLVAALTIITSITSYKTIKNYSYNYELNVENVFPFVENNRTTSLISEYIEVANLKEESLEENIDLIDEETETEIETNIEDEIEVVQVQEPIQNEVKEPTHNPVQPNREEPIKDNRTVPSNLSQHLNRYVLDVINTYNYENGSYPYLLNNDYENYNGVTENVYYKDELILKAHPSGKKYSHCTGITFEVFFKAMQNRNKDHGIEINNFNGMTKDEMVDFMLTWYVAMGPKSQSNLAVAIEKYGLGERITNLEEVAPGDFIDLSRENNTGHAVVFIDWIREGNRIIGLKHWSSQQSTSGISYKEEYFNVRDKNGNKYGNVILDSLHIARVSPINEYK
ncbi:MAG: hypothetical protein RIN55_10550 [Tissierellaceae bacterium]|nr:hypothetical protein [Tissierellaceae bacterium]